MFTGVCWIMIVCFGKCRTGEQRYLMVNIGVCWRIMVWTMLVFVEECFCLVEKHGT